MFIRPFRFELLALVVAALSLQPAMATVVYNNTTNVWGISGIGGAGTGQIGDQVTLAGSDRIVTEFLFGYKTADGTSDELARVRFYANDGPNGEPGSVLYDSDEFRVPRGSEVMTYTLKALSVLVPDTFTWTVEFSSGAGESSDGYLFFAGPPTVGSSDPDSSWLNYTYMGSSTAWIKSAGPGFRNDDFLARITAVPAPAGTLDFPLLETDPDRAFGWHANVAALKDGGFIVVRHLGSHDGDGYGIYAQRYDADAVAVGSEFQVNSFTAGNQVAPVVASLTDGSFVVAWGSDGQDGSGTGVYAQRYGADGAVAGSEFRVNTYTASDQSVSGIAALKNGGFIVLWASDGQDGNGSGVYAQRYGADGTPAGGEFRVNTETANSQYVAKVAALSNGGFVATWMSWGQDDSQSSIHAQRFSADGTPVGSEFLVNSYTPDVQSDPAVTGLKDGGFVVAWDSWAQDGSWWGIYAQRYDANGAAVGGEFRVNSYTVNAQDNAVVSALNDGGFIVAWSSWEQDGANVGAYAQRFGADGMAIGGEARLNLVNTTAAEWNPAIATLTDGRLAVVFERLGVGGYARIIAPAAPVTGTAGIDRLSGSAADDVLDGLSGADTLTGVGGQDAYMVNDPADTVIETLEGGYDTVYAAVSYTLPANTEDLMLIGANPINATGNALPNHLTGNEAANRLDGKVGADVMAGALGNDVYRVDRADDVVVEADRAGVDTLRSSVSYTLPANVEKLTLLGTAPINGTGNGLNNTLTGNSAANVLTGEDGSDRLAGGAGNDTLTGGTGRDSFLFNTTLGASNVDEIKDFNPADDTIRLENAVFATLTVTGALSASAFGVGSDAGTTAQRIIYDPATGAVYYDPDGSGTAAKIRFAALTTRPTLSRTDFVVQ